MPEVVIRKREKRKECLEKISKKTTEKKKVNAKKTNKNDKEKKLKIEIKK